jgi:glycosyltransferase involved in cell wall biosynthesis
MEEQVLCLAKAFRARGALFLPVFESGLTGRVHAEFAAAGIESADLDLRHFHGAALRRLLALIRRARIDIVHWNFYGVVNPYVLLLSLLRPRLHHYLTDHGSREVTAASSVPRIRNAFLRRYRHVLCVSDFVMAALRREGVTVPLRRISHFVNTERFRDDAQARHRLRVQHGVQDRFVTLVVAQLIPEKGIEVLLRALAKLPPTAQVWVVGNGPDADRLARLAHDLDLDRRVRFFGLQSDVQPYMQAADCLACPSLWSEAFGLVNVEAMASGLPVVASRAGGIPEIVTPGRNGILCDPGDVSQLTDAISSLIENPRLRRQLGRQARADAVDGYSVDRQIERHLDVYKLVGRRRGT